MISSHFLHYCVALNSQITDDGVPSRNYSRAARLMQFIAYLVVWNSLPAAQRRPEMTLHTSKR